MNAQIAAQTARTPGPWVADGTYISDGKPCGQFLNLVIADCESTHRSSEEAVANAAFIVQACNAHDDLVAALSKMIRIARHESDPRTIREACREAEILLTNVATAALAKAGAHV